MGGVFMPKKRRRLKKSVKRFLCIFCAVLLVLTASGIYFVCTDDKENTGTVTPNPDIGKEEIYRIELTDAYPEDLRLLFEKNEEAREFVLSYFPLLGKEQVIDLSEYADSETVPHFLQWDVRWGFLDYGGECVAVAGCGPVCLSMVGYYLTKDEDTFAPDKVVNYALDYGYCIEDVGTAWALMDEGASELGLTVETLSLSEQNIIDSVTSGNPVILIMGPGVFTSIGHFIVVHGYEDGKFLINDPNSIIRTEKKWSYSEFADQILNIWSYSYDG